MHTATPDVLEPTEAVSGSPLWNSDLARALLARRTWFVTSGLRFVLDPTVGRAPGSVT